MSLLSSVVRDLNSTMKLEKLHNLAAVKCKECHLYICPLIIGIDFTTCTKLAPIYLKIMHGNR